jgi:hypothetical protein
MKLPYGFVATSEMNERRARLIKPADIELAPDLSCGSFDSLEVAQTAGRLITVLKLMVNWKKFTTDFIRTHYRGHVWDQETMFLGLSGLVRDASMVGGWKEAGHVILLPDGFCAVTDVFILTCAKQKAAVPHPQYA